MSRSTDLLKQHPLEVVLGLLDEGVGNRLGNHVDHLALDDVEVGVNEELCDVGRGKKGQRESADDGRGEKREKEGWKTD